MNKNLRRLLFYFAPRPFWESLRFEWSMFLLRRRLGGQRLKFASTRDALVNIGAGNEGKDGWINVDAFRAPAITLTCDCRVALPLPDNCARGVFSEHFLEHLEYDHDVPLFLAECLRILKPGGIVRIVVPDAERYVRAYCAEGWQELEGLRGLGPDHRDPYFQTPLRTKMEMINLLFRQFGEHKFAYDFETISCSLSAAGFVKINKSSFGNSDLLGLAIDTPGRAHESLYVEASKELV